tara:strand:+ start:236 stop:502 length:267 start_codon:yes stop_codon:yes gene_type:complete
MVVGTVQNKVMQLLLEDLEVEQQVVMELQEVVEQEILLQQVQLKDLLVEIMLLEIHIWPVVEVVQLPLDQMQVLQLQEMVVLEHQIQF